MKAIIDGLRYNTETAEHLGHASECLGSRDFRNWEGTLYRTKSGRYFLAGSGGPMTRWAESNGNTTSGSEGIIPLSKSEALAWAERNLSAETVESAFNEDIKDA